MKGNLKYKIILGGTMLVFFIYEFTKPTPTDWRETLYSQDKIPYGAFVLQNLLPDLFPNSEVTTNNDSFYQIIKADSSEQNLMVLAKSFSPSNEDLNQLVKVVRDGAHLIIFAEHIGENLQDTFDISTEYLINSDQFLNAEDTSHLTISNQKFDIPNAFVRSTISDVESVDVEATVGADDIPILASKSFGEGKIVFCTVPLILSNYYLMSGENYQLMNPIFNLVPDQNIVWTELYQVGRLESGTPLRYILSQPAIKWAYYILMGALVLFIIFRAKREQRAIPIVLPPQNTSIEFVETVGQLYLNQGNHKNIVDKKILYLKDYIYTHYYLHVHFEPDEINRLAHKTGKTEEEIKKLFLAVRNAQNRAVISREELLQFNTIIESFYPN